MASRKSKIEFPPETCGVCQRAIRDDSGEFQCLALPPQFSSDDTGGFWMRGAPVDPTDPACVYFQPRLHA